MRIRSVTSLCTRSISALPVAATSLPMKIFVHAEHFHRIALALPGSTHQIAFNASRAACALSPPDANPFTRRHFQHDAQIVELIELIEVDRRDLPAAPETDFQIAFALQPEQAVAHRRARHAVVLRDAVLRKAVAGKQAKVEDIGLQLLINLLGKRIGRAAAPRASILRVSSRLVGSSFIMQGSLFFLLSAFQGSAMRLTCAATIFQPSAGPRRAQVCI